MVWAAPGEPCPFSLRGNNQFGYDYSLWESTGRSVNILFWRYFWRYDTKMPLVFTFNISVLCCQF